MSNLDVSMRLKLVNMLSAPAKQAKSELEGISRAARALNGAGTGDKLAHDLNRVGTAAEKAGAKVQKLSQATKVLGTGGAASGLGALGARALSALGAGYVAKQAFNQAVDWDSAWTEVRKKVNASEEQFAQLEQTIRSLSLSLGIGRSEMAGLTAEAGAAGIAYGDLEKFMTLTTKAADGWGIAVREASKKLAYTKAATGYTIDELGVLADKINALGDNSSAAESEILDMFLSVGSAAREAGVKVNETLAILTGVRSGGMDPAVAARWFGALTSGLRTAEQAPKKVQEGFKMLGLTAKQVATGMKKDGAGTILDLFRRLEKSPKAVEAAVAIFGKEWWDETMRAKGGLAEVIKQIEFINNPSNYQGSLDKSFDLKTKTAQFHLTQMYELVSRIGEKLAGWTIPPLNRAVDSAVAAMDNLEKRASVWERWSREEEARLRAMGVLTSPGQEEQGPPIPPGLDDAPDWIKKFRKAVYGDTRTADAVLSDWLFGKPNSKDEQLKQAEENGRSAGEAEREQQQKRDVVSLLERQIELEKELAAAQSAAAGGDLGAQNKVIAVQAALAQIKTEIETAMKMPGAAEAVAQSMRAVAEAVSTQGEEAVQAAQAIAERIKALFNFTASPTISPQFAPSGGASKLPPAPLPPSRPKSLGDRAAVQTNTFHITTSDPEAAAAAVHRQLARLGNTSNALFDTA